MALAAQWQTVATVTTTAGTVFTTPATPVYQRDLVINNSGASTIFVGMGASNVATSVASFGIPAGGDLILAACAVPVSTPVTALTGSGSSSVSIGYGSLINFT